VLTKIPDGLGGTLLTTAIGNAGGLKSEGAELTFAASLSSSWSVNGGVTLARAHFTNYVYIATTNYTGTRLTNAPRAAVFLGADYQTQVLFGLTMDAHIDYSYRSKIWTVVGQPDYSVVPAFGLMNARVGFTPANSNLQFGLYARNLGNRYFSTGWQQYGALGLLHYTSQNAYRTLGGFVKYEY
jgi:iron complex outermembrane receptor protein